MSLIPPVGTTGIFRLKSPFQELLRSNTSYRCDAISRFSSIYEQNQDPFVNYYQRYGLDRAAFDRDIANNVSIISLVSTAEHWVYVPSSYIESFPNQGGVQYQGLVLGVPLGAVPTFMDLTAVRTAVQNVVRDMMGISVAASYVAVTPVQIVKVEDHNALMAARAGAIETSQTDSAKAKHWEAMYREMQTKYNELAAYVTANQ